MSKATTTILLLLLLALLLLPGGSIGTSAPFKADRLCVLVVEETAERGKLTSGQLDVISSQAAGSVQDYVRTHGGDIRIADSSKPPVQSADWVKAAYAVERKSLPWIVAANKSGGFSQPVTTPEEALRLLKPLGGK